MGRIDDELDDEDVQEFKVDGLRWPQLDGELGGKEQIERMVVKMDIYDPDTIEEAGDFAAQRRKD